MFAPLPEVPACGNPFKKQLADLNEYILLNDTCVAIFPPDVALSHSLLSRLMGTAFTSAVTAHCGLILLAARRQNRSDGRYTQPALQIHFVW